MNKTIYTVDINYPDANLDAREETFGSWTIYRDGEFFARGHFADFGSETVIDEGSSIGWMGDNTLIYLLVEDAL